MKRFLNSLIADRSPLRLFWHQAKALVAAVRYGFPARSLTVVAITGTDGKTTTVGMITHILHTCGIAVGSASTAFLQICSELRENPTHLTSLSPFALQKFLAELKRKQFSCAVIEMSSHGLVQGRVNHTYPAVAGITNTALEHLDYHKSMEQYRKDKAIMFHMLRGRGTKVLNITDETYKTYRDIPSKQTMTYGSTEADLYAKDIQASSDSTRAVIVNEGKTYPLSLTIPGTFNISNALCALGCIRALGIDLEQGTKALASFKGIPGRMEKIEEGQSFSVFVDFAVSPQAYQKTLEALRSMVGEAGRVLVLCSSCGNRMKEKRPEVGRICSALADVVVATEDETYGEDPHAVLEEVWAGVDQRACEAHKIFDRREAIKFLFSHAKPGDAVVLCGMGPFSTMTKLEGRVPWDERDVARELLKAL